MKTSTKKIANVTLVSCLLLMQPAYAGIPVTDGFMATLAQAQNMWVKFTQFAAETKYYADMAINWDVHLKSLIAEKMDELKGEHNVIGLSKAEKEKFFEEKELDCRQSSNGESAKFCLKMVRIERLIAEQQEKSVKEKNDLLTKINAKIAKRNALAGKAQNKEKVVTLNQEIQMLQDKLNSYDTKHASVIADLDREHAMVAEARQRVVRNQLKGTSNITPLVVKAETIKDIQDETDEVRNKIQQLKMRNDNESNNAFNQNSR